MDETAWLGSGDATGMVNFLRGKHNRKLRLFFCACARSVAHLFVTPLQQEALRAGEELADGQIGDGDVVAIRQAFSPNGFFEGGSVNLAACGAIADGFPVSPLWAAAELHAAQAIKLVRSQGRINLPKEVLPAIRRSQADLLRDIFGNPFRPAALNPRWRTSDVVGLARAIYDDRAFERMPILADALMDAGCEDEQIISHCRGEGPHVRGCWVVDLILEKQ